MDGVTTADGGATSGNIASVTTNETGCGGTDHPWLIKVRSPEGMSGLGILT